MLEGLLEAWDGEEAVVHFDQPTGAWIFLAIHSRLRGPACGGTRMKPYPEPADGLADAMRLSAGMTKKMAAVDLPFGGGKAVIALARPLAPSERRELLLRYGEMVESLGGNYRTGPDVGTTVADMDVIGERSQWVVCRSREHGGSGDPGPHTARGVFHGIRASVGHVFDSDDLTGRVVLVQGVGDVGAPLAEDLAAAGARLLVSDVSTDRVEAVAAKIGATVVAPEEAVSQWCDVYAPCALGGTLDATTIPKLRCRIVAGSANNQLAEPDDADRLGRAGILYAPDFVINAGGVLYSLGLESLGWTTEQVESRLAGIGNTLLDIYRRADGAGITTAAAADALADSRLSKAALRGVPDMMAADAGPP
jgi:leucine dehydrogenase